MTALTSVLVIGFFEDTIKLMVALVFFMPVIAGLGGNAGGQTLALIMEEHGISSCFQGALGQFPDPVRECLNIPDQQGILFGISFGYKDDTAPVNTTRTDREPLGNSVVFCQ